MYFYILTLQSVICWCLFSTSAAIHFSEPHRASFAHWLCFTLSHRRLHWATPKVTPESCGHSVISRKVWTSIPSCFKIRILLFGADSLSQLLILRLRFVKKFLFCCPTFADAWYTSAKCIFLMWESCVNFWAQLALSSWQTVTPNVSLPSVLFPSWVIHSTSLRT